MDTKNALTVVAADKKLAAAFTAARADKSLRWAAERLFLEQAAARAPKITQCSPESLRSFLLDLANSGLSLNPRLGQVYCIPYWNEKAGRTEAQFMVGFRGMLHLVFKAGTVAGIQAVPVHRGDEFQVRTENNQRTIHHVERGPRTGDPVAVYCIATLTTGAHHIEVMYGEDLAAVERQAKQRPGGGMVWNGPWRIEMMKKSVIRRAWKNWPLDAGGQMAHAMAVVDKAEPVRFETAPEPEQSPEQEPCLSQEQVLALEASLADHDIPNPGQWVSRLAEAMGAPGPTMIPASRFNEAMERLAKRREAWAARLAG